MRLKVSPKEALKEINQLVLDASVHLCSIECDHFEKVHAYQSKKSKNKKSYRQTTAFKKDVDKYDKDFWVWHELATETLLNIFTDYVPVYAFKYARTKMKSFVDEVKDDDEYFSLLIEDYRTRVDVLVQHYNELQKLAKSPLFYLPESVTLCFYDFVCPLKVDSNEASLCMFMFEHSIGEKVEMIDAYNHMFGEQRTTLGAAEKDKIKNAVDGINRKTNKAFGFPIIAKDTTTINLTVPARVTQSML